MSIKPMERKPPRCALRRRSSARYANKVLLRGAQHAIVDA